MKIGINKYNKDAYINTLCESLRMFIGFCNGYTDNLQYNNYKTLAETILNEYNNICLHVFEFCFNSNEVIGNTIYPEKMLHALYSFRDYCFNWDAEKREYIFEPDINKQKEKTKNYIHFDFSVKRPKTLKEV
jgi:hypothetical protein